MLFVLSLLSLSSFAVEISDNGSRISINVTLILTAVAFKFILAGTLPKVPYNTLIDYYILFCSMTLAAMNFLIILPSFFIDESDDNSLASMVNYTLGWVCFGSIAFGFIFWVLYAHIITRKKTRSNEIVLGKTSNWYNYRFSDPPFFEPTLIAVKNM